MELPGRRGYSFRSLCRYGAHGGAKGRVSPQPEHQVERKPDKILDEANKLIFVRRYSAAEEILEGLLRDPATSENILVHLRRIELAVKLEKVEPLSQTYKADLKKNPGSTVLKIANILLEQHGEVITPSESAAAFQRLLSELGSHAAIYYGLGFAFEVSGNMDRAIYNYEQCINTDPGFYPGFFGLSQVYYQNGVEDKGDYFFYLFEEAAPYNVYGNFETHRRLSLDYLEKDHFEEARTAIGTLSDWWVENKGMCPPEIQVFESLMLARIYEKSGDRENAAFYLSQANVMGNQILNQKDVEESVLYFVAKSLEEFSNFETAYKFYKKILSSEVSSPEMVQKIGGQFLSMGEYKLARELFEEAYKVHADNPEIRFCRLVSGLKLDGVNVEEYLMSKERMRQLSKNPGDRVELLSLLHSLLARYKEDPDVLSSMAEVYLRLGNRDRARRHYTELYELDCHSRISALKYASFHMQYGDQQEGKRVLDGLENLETLSATHQAEIYWLKATWFRNAGEFQNSRQQVQKILQRDPWNVSYLVLDIINLTKLTKFDEDDSGEDPLLEELSRGVEENLNWSAFDSRTRSLADGHYIELAYLREKLRFLYADGDLRYLENLVKAACAFDASRATYDFLRLLNTNFDGPQVYWALGMLFKETWQLETAAMWFEQVLSYPDVPDSYRGKAYLELSDCFIWRGNHLVKAIEYIKLAVSLGERGEGRAQIFLAHAFLKSGEVRQAEVYLEDTEVAQNFEAVYLRGLVQYRNGAADKANQIWKPLLTVRSKNLRFHHIKQEILKFYFEKTPYIDAN